MNAATLLHMAGSWMFWFAISFSGTSVAINFYLERRMTRIWAQFQAEMETRSLAKTPPAWERMAREHANHLGKIERGTQIEN